MSEYQRKRRVERDERRALHIKEYNDAYRDARDNKGKTVAEAKKLASLHAGKCKEARLLETGWETEEECSDEDQWMDSINNHETKAVSTQQKVATGVERVVRARVAERKLVSSPIPT